MLTELRVTNFKGFAGEHRVPLAPLTLLFGSNSSGKTALLHALALLAENLGASPFRRPTGNFDLAVPDLDLGGYRNLIHRHHVTPDTFIGLGFTANLMGFRHHRSHDIIDPLGATAASHDFRFVQTDDGRVRPAASSTVLHCPEDIPLEFYQADPRRPLQLGSLTPESAQVSATAIHELISRLLGATPEPGETSQEDEDDDLIDLAMVPNLTLDQLARITPEGLRRMLESKTQLSASWGAIGHFGAWANRREEALGIPSQLADLFTRVIAAANLIARQSLSRTDYLGPMRDVPSRLEEIEPHSRDRLTSSGTGIAAMLSRHSRALPIVNATLRELDIPYTVDVMAVGQEALPSAGDYRALVLTDLRTRTQVSPRDLGFGITQLLPILVALARRSPSLLLIEQPELHLHPRLHAELASLFVKATRHEQATQVIAETHSENLILRVQKLIRERQLSPDEVSIVYVGSSDGAGSWIEPIRVNEKGELIDSWPGGFFTERAQEWL